MVATGASARDKSASWIAISAAAVVLGLAAPSIADVGGEALISEASVEAEAPWVLPEETRPSIGPHEYFKGSRTERAVAAVLAGEASSRAAVAESTRAHAEVKEGRTAHAVAGPEPADGSSAESPTAEPPPIDSAFGAAPPAATESPDEESLAAEAREAGIALPPLTNVSRPTPGTESSIVEIPQVEPGAAAESRGETSSSLEDAVPVTTPPPPELRSLREFVSLGTVTSPIGVELRESRRTLKSGEEAEGLLVLKVEDGSAAAKAGLRSYRHGTRDVLDTMVLGAAMVFPPAIFALPAIDYTEVGVTYDMIVGIDGVRVTNFLDFEDRMHDVRPGQLIYLSIVRDGRRLQVAIPVTQAIANSAN